MTLAVSRHWAKTIRSRYALLGGGGESPGIAKGLSGPDRSAPLGHHRLVAHRHAWVEP